MKKLLVLSLLTSLVAHAEEVATTKKDGVKIKSTKSSDKADELITNRRFRAQNGSLSNLSLNASVNYSGGSLNAPLSDERPNLVAAGDAITVSNASAGVSGSYRLNTLNRIGFGASMSMVAPLNNEVRGEENDRELEVFNPFLSYTTMNKFFGVQTVASLSYTQYTFESQRNTGYLNSVQGSLNTMYDFGGSKFSVGFLALYSRNTFDNSDADNLESQNETVWGFLPQAEYVINDTFNLRTIVRSNWYQNNRKDGANDFAQRVVSQSVGLGISLNRDVFLYPNIQFIPQDMRAANTNVGFSANINMF